MIHSISTSLELLGNTSFMRNIYLFLFGSNAEENLALKSLANFDPTFRNLMLAFLRLSQLIPIHGFSSSQFKDLMPNSFMGILLDLFLFLKLDLGVQTWVLLCANQDDTVNSCSFLRQYSRNIPSV